MWAKRHFALPAVSSFRSRAAKVAVEYAALSCNILFEVCKRHAISSLHVFAFLTVCISLRVGFGWMTAS